MVDKHYGVDLEYKGLRLRHTSKQGNIKQHRKKNKSFDNKQFSQSQQKSPGHDIDDNELMEYSK